MEEFTHSEASIQPDPSTVDGAEIIKAAVTEALSNPVSWTDFVKQLMKIKPKDIAPKEYMKLIGQQWRAREAGMKTPSHNERARVMPEVLPNMYELVQKGAGFKRKNEKVVKSKAVHASLSAIKEEGTDDASSESESDDSTEGVTLVESSSNDESGSDEIEEVPLAKKAKKTAKKITSSSVAASLSQKVLKKRKVSPQPTTEDAGVEEDVDSSKALPVKRSHNRMQEFAEQVLRPSNSKKYQVFRTKKNRRLFTKCLSEAATDIHNGKLSAKQALLVGASIPFRYLCKS